MKYILKNIIKFIRDDTLIFFLILLTVVMSSFMLNFSYGVYQNYEMKKEGSSEEQKSIYIEYTYNIERIDIGHPAGMYKLADYDGNTVTIKMLKNCLSKIDDSVLNEIESIHTQASFYNNALMLHFLFGEGKFMINEAFGDRAVASGRYFTQEDFDENSKVALAFDYENINVGDNPLTEEMLYDDNHIKLGNELYEIIGYHRATVDSPLIPITALPEDTTVWNALIIEFKDNINLYQYMEISDAVEECFGNLAYVRPVELPDIDTIRLYNTIIIIAVIISVIAAVNFAILFRYILRKRQQQIACMRVCGLKYYKTVLYYLGECMLIALPVYILTTLCFAKWILPWMSDFYRYGFRTYNRMVYIYLFGIYFAISMGVLLVMIFTSVKRNRVISEV